MSTYKLLDMPLNERATDDSGGAKTLREYLVALLLTLWDEEDGFSGKRPFGNSGWKYPIYETMIEECVVAGTLDEYGDVVEIDSDAADELIMKAIKELK